MWILGYAYGHPKLLLDRSYVRAANASAGWLWLVVGMSAFGWTGLVIYGPLPCPRERDYVKAAKYMGVNSSRLLSGILSPTLLYHYPSILSWDHQLHRV